MQERLLDFLTVSPTRVNFQGYMESLRQVCCGWNLCWRWASVRYLVQLLTEYEVVSSEKGWAEWFRSVCYCLNSCGKDEHPYTIHKMIPTGFLVAPDFLFRVESVHTNCYLRECYVLLWASDLMTSFGKNECTNHSVNFERTTTLSGICPVSWFRPRFLFPTN